MAPAARAVIALLLVVSAAGTPAAAPAPLLAATVQGSTEGSRRAFEGVVQPVRQTILAAQVPGAVLALAVKAGDKVQTGQWLVRLDARAAEQTAAAGAALVQAARAALEAAAREFDRQRQLHQKNYISQAALDRAEAQFKTAQAETSAQLASAGAARTQTDFYLLRAPYAGVVSEVAVVVGDMALPGKPLVTLHDPAALRVSTMVPQSVAATLASNPAAEIELPGTSGRRIAPLRSQWLPTADPSTHTVELRLDLPAGLRGIAPGVFVQTWLPTQPDPGSAAPDRVFVPAAATFRRAELTAVYVLDADGRAMLRQVRLGRRDGDRVEVLSGLKAGERVALDPHAAARRP